MTHIPIIFSAPMVRALLCEAEAPGTGKTMTRRLAWRTHVGWVAIPEGQRPSPWQRVTPGDRLWVREHAAFTIDQGTGKPAKTEWFFADGENPYADNLTVESRPSIHMPRWASRLTLVVTATKIERLQSIKRADAIAEGIRWVESDHGWTFDNTLIFGYPRDAFAHLWCRLHGPKAWDANPEVIALTFTVHQTNIDSVPR